MNSCENSMLDAFDKIIFNKNVVLVIIRGEIYHIKNVSKKDKEEMLMRATKERCVEQQRLAVDIDGLATMLSCGTSTAKKIAELAEARIVIGRRVLYSVGKVETYLDRIAV